MGGLPVIETESPFDLVKGGTLSQAPDVFIKSHAGTLAYEIGVNKDKCLLYIEPNGYNIHCVLEGELIADFLRKFRGMVEFLVIG